MKKEESDINQTLEETQSSFSKIAPGEIIIGTLIEIDNQGHPLVNFTENKSRRPISAISTLGVSKTHIGRQVALLFANGNLNNPVIMGIIHNPLDEMLENFNQDQSVVGENIAVESNMKIDDVLVDGNKIVFEAQEEIVLKCGESSITLTKAGKILIRGKYLLNRSTGVNRIMGGSVQVN